MQLSKSDLLLLSNFASINQSILFKPGREQKTISNSEMMMAIAKFDADFPTEFAIYDLNHFISVYNLVSLTGDVELDFYEENQLMIKSEKTRQNLRAAPIEIIRVPPKNGVPDKDPVVSFTLTEEMLHYGKKAAAVNGFSNLIFESDGKDLYMVAKDVEVPNSETHRRKLEQNSENLIEFRAIFSVSRLKMLQDEYRVDIFSPNLGGFTSKNREYNFYSGLDVDITI